MTQPRLYLTAPPTEPSTFAPVLEDVLRSVPIACVRLALGESTDEAAWIDAANHLLPICHRYEVALVATDHFRLVTGLGLDGVHLANSRTPLREIRKTLGSERIIGAHAGTSRHQGMVLAEAGADYVSFGPVRTDGVLGDDANAGDDLFEWWSEMIETPSVAEGGVTLEDAARLATYADFLVPFLSIWDADDPVGELHRFAEAVPPFD